MVINPKHIVITPGEPAGIGPDVTLRMLQDAWPDALTVIADPDMLQSRAKQLNLSIDIIERDLNQPLQAHQPGQLHVLPVKLGAPVAPGKPTPANAAYVLETLRIAANLCQTQQALSIVTGPVQKNVINDAGIAFSGHTEFFAELAGVEQTVMLFVIDNLKVALATTHLPLAEVPAKLTKQHLVQVSRILHDGLRTQFGISQPRILVCGLNPHAGEQGYLGREEIDVMQPAIAQLRSEGIDLSDPLPADTIFTPNKLAQADAVLAMYHDQALPVVKYIGFDRAVNVTLGLPFLRTSVDHGTALDIAGTGQANPGSLNAATVIASAAKQSSSKRSP